MINFILGLVMATIINNNNIKEAEVIKSADGIVMVETDGNIYEYYGDTEKQNVILVFNNKGEIINAL